MPATCGTPANRPPLLLSYTTSLVQGCQHPFRWTPASSGASAPCTIRAPRPPFRPHRHPTRRSTPIGGSRPPRRQCHTPTHALHTPLRALRVARTPLTFALSPSSVSLPSRYPSPSSHLGFVVSCADSSGFRIRFALSNSWTRIHGMGTMAVGSYTDAPVHSLCLLTASPNSGKRLPLDEFVALDTTPTRCICTT
ncbi:uncharacterized protein SCHCODRAFT_02510171 [Schizophyllum commune H4-8]|uniref:Expressed protein n=1 Tax=Schizophyllum commune (strain H4-8 / FGSC 9210) TaxID=578458 RepID=D8QBT3_SCHCM|nr:uncharacterized protein SCHCODRAFT_02510171 [Schizophyllum commune H4-8]KAI5889304.1 hypothetical protein SCHCODRAFT_02510171 [Schizophyllum commune H4-8]